MKYDRVIGIESGYVWVTRKTSFMKLLIRQKYFVFTVMVNRNYTHALKTFLYGEQKLDLLTSNVLYY